MHEAVEGIAPADEEAVDDVVDGRAVVRVEPHRVTAVACAGDAPGCAGGTDLVDVGHHDVRTGRGERQADGAPEAAAAAGDQGDAAGQVARHARSLPPGRAVHAPVDVHGPAHP
ncbi:hypothetical protein GCM10025868_31560 [Angustibacter aerolatus]|uniref:Uncharacterized protein n=1 Tax=Angustibacter aerolatus TaxID=1162965 RepID=A0ABQ6JMG1_9ACTN|nr:hypothetical protein GCM10025868_31560 [Angustibacter aerolatus]